MERAKKVIEEVHEDFAHHFGRMYHQVEGYLEEDAEVLVVCTGTAASTARVAVEALRAEGERAGLVKIKTFRPFPGEEIMGALKGKKKVAVIDRNFSPGAQGIWAQELRSVLCELSDQERPMVYGYIAGIGGCDISVKTIKEIYYRTLGSHRPDDIDMWIGVRHV
jgi:pyruvate/2-oxoacid:ferredoxin oxidoreductase alpha subunit